MKYNKLLCKFLSLLLVSTMFSPFMTSVANAATALMDTICAGYSSFISSVNNDKNQAFCAVCKDNIINKVATKMFDMGT